jgi:hypothetical protein
VLEAGDPVVDRLPSRGDQVDLKGEVVNACVPLGKEVALDAFEPPDDLVHQPTDLGKVAADRLHLLAQAVLDGALDLRGEGRLEARSGLGKLFDLSASALERGVDCSRVGPAFRRLPKPLSCFLDRFVGHRRGA